MIENLDFAPKNLKEEWILLQEKAKMISSKTIKQLLEEDSKRVETFSIRQNGVFFDYSKHLIDKDILNELFKLLEKVNLKHAIKEMFSGEKINHTENRSALHIALRNRVNTPIDVDGVNVMNDVNLMLEKMSRFARSVRKGEWRGATNKKIKHIINIGIGGSDLGPKMAYNALKAFSDRTISFDFISNVDGSNFFEVIRDKDPASTLFIVSSKTFTTQETMSNAYLAKDWILQALEKKSAIASHFVAVSTNEKAVRDFGIDLGNMFIFWDWVGGRYSLASSIGLSLMIAIGPEHFCEMLDGMHYIDQHFLNSPHHENIPVIMALLGIWYNNFLDSQTHAVLPYSEYLKFFPSYLQQADMESNGKSVDKEGQEIKYQTGPVIWGECGTNGQHAFYQLIHQGTKIIPVDFIGYVNPINSSLDAHIKLMSNMFAQSEALALGRSRDIVKQEESDWSLVEYKIFSGNRPSTTILFDRLTPYTLGQLIAMYEHKIFVQGVIWNINSFDQWGVELGKILANRIIRKIINKDNSGDEMISSNDYLLSYFCDNIKKI